MTGEHRFIALWAHPRCLSTAMLRMMIQRGDFRCLLEPFACLYYLHDAKAREPFIAPDPAHPLSYPDTRRWLLDFAARGPLFIKDMSYYVVAYLERDPEFVRAMRSAFIIRHPRRSIASYLRVHPAVSCEEIGLAALHRHFELVARLQPEHPPLVIDADDILDNPPGMVRALCAALDIPFLPQALSWPPGAPPEFTGWEAWLDEVSDSTGLHRREACSPRKPPADSPRLRELLAHHLPHYEALHAHRLAPLAEPAAD